jgi:hypothetical protein
MSQVPLSVNQLETIVEVVSRDLLEQWAINDRFKEEEMTQAAQNSVNDTVFVINAFMEHFNTYMMTQAKESKINL